MTSRLPIYPDRVWLVRARLDYENSLLNQRTTWVVASQAFLLTAFGICVVGTRSSNLGSHSSPLETLVALLPWAAIFSLILLYVTIAGGLLAMARLRRAHEPEDPFDRLILQGSRVSGLAGLAAPVLIPAVFILLWTAVIVRP